MNARQWLFFLLVSVTLAGCQSTTDYQQAGGKKEITLDTNKYADSPANVYINLSKAYLAQGEINTALDYAKKGVYKDSANPNTHHILALNYQRLGQFSKAETGFRKALSISPNQPYINNTYGNFLCDQGKFDKSLIHFRKTIDHPLYKKKWIPMTNVGICALRSDNLEIAEEYLRKALQNNGKFNIALYNMIKLSVLQENYWSARAYLQRYLEVGKHDPKTLWWGIKTETILGDRDRLDSYKLLLRVKYPDSEEATMLLADKKLP